MKISIRIMALLIVYVTLSSNLSLSGQYAEYHLNRPYGLMVEFIRKPAGTLIGDPSPEFSWIVPSEAVSQKAYQVIVSSTAERININEADVWNSGEVRSSNSFNISLGNKIKSSVYKVSLNAGTNKIEIRLKDSSGN